MRKTFSDQMWVVCVSPRFSRLNYFKDFNFLRYITQCQETFQKDFVPFILTEATQKKGSI